MRLNVCLIAACVVNLVVAPIYAQSIASTPKPVRALSLAGLTAGPSVEGVSEFQLPNGMKVLLARDESKPTVTVNLTYLVGSRHENYGETGMAHLLEHLLFKGTPKNPKVWGEFTKRGFRANGSTWTDRTNYFASFAYDEKNLDWYVRWLADSMINSFIARKDLDSEMTVVRNEMESGENSPDGILVERIMSAAYQWHNYGKSTIGARADVENVDIGRLQAFYKMYYQPDNAVLIVSGKFEPAQIQKIVLDSFGKIPKPKRILPNQYTLDPVQDGEKTVIVRRPGGAPILISAYHMPASAHPDSAAVGLLETIVGGAPSGRLYKALVETKLASEVYGFGFNFKEPTLTFFGAQLPAQADAASVQTQLTAAIESFAKQPVTGEELERARIKWLKDWELAYTDPERVGVQLSEAIALGDWRLFFLQRDRVKKVQLAEIQRVATERLLPDNRTSGLFLPTDKPLRSPNPAKADVVAELKDYKGDANFSTGESFAATPENIDKRTERSTLNNGIKLALLSKSTRGKVVTAQLRMEHGSLDSLTGQGDIAGAVRALLTRGTKTKDQQQIQDALDKLKAQVSVGGWAGATIVTVVTTRDNLVDALKLVSELIREPIFAQARLDEYRTQVITGLNNAQKEPEAIASNMMARQDNPYPKGDPRYASTFEEDIASAQALKQSDLVKFHSEFFGVQNAFFSAVGDFDAAAVKQLLETSFAGFKAKQIATRVPMPYRATKAADLTAQTPDKQNATLIANTTFALKEMDPDHAALIVANHIFGGGTNSRLWNRIREKDGLSYGVGSSMDISAWEPASTWSMYAIFAPQNLGKVRAAFKQELDDALSKGFTQKEVEEAISSLLKSRSLSRAQDPGVVGAWVNHLRLGRTYAVSAELDKRLSAITVEQANAAMRKYIKGDTIVFVQAGDFAKK